ncbi:hypothetical protein SAMN06264346_10967 [Chryseobacterium profundimaris]|uniref:SbsA Ig-like domain-containing protein n=2 Tax=Chryseobacterium profundimaris TaxID=1387275 RepID=A0ABY1P5J1_9FLAO|nr:hypothetical protein SAMN06264346_10967 [Chryseobacterium profundimaris]
MRIKSPHIILFNQLLHSMRKTIQAKSKGLYIFFCILLYSIYFSQEIAINSKNPDKPIFKAFPIEENIKQPSDIFKIFMIQNNTESQTSLLGSYYKIEDTIFFEPQFELGEGLSFSVNFSYKNNTVKKLYKTKPIDNSIIQEIDVKEIYPRDNKIPKNVLTFYVEFPVPMIEDESVYRYVNLLDENKKTLAHVWYNKARWISDKVMMIMIHPGRVKKDISYYDNLGEIFTVSKKYYLEITDKIKPLNSNSKLIYFTKEFEIINPLNTCPKVLEDKLNNPKKNTFDKLKIAFDRPIDFFSAQIGISVKNYDSDIAFEGKIIPGSEDTEWYFVPAKPWTEKKYTLIFNKYLSDPSGNSLIKPFETTTIKKSYTRPVAKKINIKINDK